MSRLLFFFFLPCWLGAQGPLDGYLKGKGRLDIAPSFSFNSARKFLGAGGSAYDEVYHGQMLSLFAEYGLTRHIDLVGNAAAVFTPTQSGLQDGGLFVKYRPVYESLGKAGKIGCLLGTGASFPLRNYSPTATGALGQKAISMPFKIIVQWETPLGLFFNLTGGYHLRLDKLSEADIETIRANIPDYQAINPKNFTTWLAKAGFPAAHFYIDGWVEYQHTTGGNNYVPHVPDLAQAFGVSYTQVGGTVYYSDQGKNGFYLSGGYMLKGRNVGKIQRLTVGLVLKL